MMHVANNVLMVKINRAVQHACIVKSVDHNNVTFDFNVIFLLVSMMIIVSIATRSGMFNWVANEMLKKTNTTYAPWYVLESNDKKYARIKALRVVIDAIEARMDM